MEKVLVIGFRSGLIEALISLNIPFAVWHEKPLPKKFNIKDPLIQPIPLSKEKIKSVAQQFIQSGPYTHVIAGTEGAVVAASIVRRVLNCRLSQHSTIAKCHDKLAMKEYLATHHIPMAKFLLHHKHVDAHGIVDSLKFPVVVKQRQQSGGRGTLFLNNLTELQAAMSLGRMYEQYIDGNEASVETFINNGEIFFVNITQYFEKTHVNLVPAQLELHWQQKLLALNEKIIKALKIKWGMTHAEFYLTSQGIYFGEIALRPPGGYIMELMRKAYGFNAWEAFVAMELNYPFQFPEKSVAWSAVNILHPGAGEIQSIVGVETVKALASFDCLKLKVKIGETISSRDGVSDEVGHYILLNENKDVLLADLHRSLNRLKILLV